MPEINKVNLRDKLALFQSHWDPKIVGDLNGQQVKLVKFLGEFVWHHHEHEDEMFLVVDGSFVMEFRDRDLTLNEGEFLIVPRGVEHRPGRRTRSARALVRTGDHAQHRQRRERPDAHDT
jgi:mannose-6-phosphate isomerase-like protein (cupin superfamily)